MLPPVMDTLSEFCGEIVPNSYVGAKSESVLRLIIAVTSSIVNVGGPCCTSSKDVGLVPAPVKSNRFKKKRYHSREINPVVGSIICTRGAGILVMFNGLAVTHWFHQQSVQRPQSQS